MDIDKIHRNFFIIFSLILIVLYGYFILRHLFTKNKECTIFKGSCPKGHYCGINGRCVLGRENDSCFLGLAQCRRPYNCYPDFKCHKF